jgi:exodeoxyribonuclease V
MSWSPQQSAAIRAVKKWHKDKSGPQVFRLFGYAGTGKTTIARAIREEIKGMALFGAFTGKASLVLRNKGCDHASTIHSMIYKVEDDGPQPVFVKNPDSGVRSAKLVIIDECSMVDEELGRDLLSFGTKVLVLGDPAQLPPVSGAGFFTSQRPDVMLTEIHRQAADNPIIRMSMEIREGRSLQVGMYGDSKVIRRASVGQKAVLAADQVLIGLNKTRREFNRRIRALKGIEGELPVAGDRLVCLKNEKELQLLNGGIWTATEASPPDSDGIVTMKVTTEDDPLITKPVEVNVLQNFFLGTEDRLQWNERRGFQEFDYGYALTVHKSQGSQWNNVMVFDESRTFREDAQRWLYTAVTRAAERVTVVI